MHFSKIHRDFHKGNNIHLQALDNYGVDFVSRFSNETSSYLMPVSIFSNTAILGIPEVTKNVSQPNYLRNSHNFLNSELDFFKNTSVETGLQKIILSADDSQVLNKGNISKNLLVEDYLARTSGFELNNGEYIIKL